MEQTLQIILNARDATANAFASARGGLDSFKGKVESFEPAFKKMATVGTIAFGAITAVAVSSFKAFADAEAQTEITNQSLQNTLDGLSAGALEKLKTQLGNVSSAFAGVANSAIDAGKSAIQMGFDDETASRSFAKLFGITKDVTQANKELGIAMDLARFKGISLEEATQKLVMVHAGATKELKALGIAVDDTATAEQNLDSINKQVTGSAETFANTAQGAMEKLKVQTDNLKETIGGALAPAFAKIVEAITPLLTKFSEWAEKNPELLSKIIMIVGGLAALVAVLGTLGLVLPTIIAGFTLLMGPVGLVIAAIAAIAFGVYQIITNWDALVAYFTMLWESVKKKFQEATEAIKNTVRLFLDTVNNIWKNVWGGIRDFFNSLWQGILNTVRSTVESIKNFLQPVIDLINKVVNGLVSIGKAVGHGVSGAIDWFSNKLGINDGIVQGGKIISTHPDDYIMAAKDPSMFGGGKGVTVQILGGTYLSEEAAYQMGDIILNRLRMELRM